MTVQVAEVPRRLAGGLSRVEGLGLALPPFATSKAIALLAPMLTVWARSSGGGLPPAGDLLRPFALWDGAAYAQIAAHGYPVGALSTALNSPFYVWARFPGYPLLVHLVSYPVPQTVAAGIVVSAAGELVALVFLARLVLQEGRDREAARFACWALALFPYAFYLTAVYTESLFLACAIPCLYWMRQGREGRASLAAAAAMLVHVTGLALVPALVVQHLMRRRGRPGASLIAILASLLVLAGFAGYSWLLTGDPLAYVHIAESPSFDRVLAWPWAGAKTTWDAIFRGPGSSSFIFGMEILFGTAGLGAVVWMALRWRSVALSLTVYAAALWLMASCVVYWLGMPRFEMTAVPAYLLAADLVAGRPPLRRALLVGSAAWMGFVCTLAATGQFMA
jgi:hypothetical protein